MLERVIQTAANNGAAFLTMEAAAREFQNKNPSPLGRGVG
jgi:hypothetical protein